MFKNFQELYDECVGSEYYTALEICKILDIPNVSFLTAKNLDRQIEECIYNLAEDGCCVYLTHDLWYRCLISKDGKFFNDRTDNFGCIYNAILKSLKSAKAKIKP